MGKEQIKTSEIHFRCEDALKHQIDNYVVRYNEKYGHIKKRNKTRIIEEAIFEYLKRNKDNIPIIEDGK